jgi:hypothetical protein
MGICTPNGLEIEFPGLLFPQNATPITPNKVDYALQLKRQDDNLPESTLGPGSPAHRICHMQLVHGDYDFEHKDWSQYKPETYAVILQEPMPSSNARVNYQSSGALVSIYAFSEGTFSVRYLSAVNVKRSLPYEESPSTGGLALQSPSDAGGFNVANVANVAARVTNIDSLKADLVRGYGPILRPAQREGFISVELTGQNQKWCVG